MGNYEALHLRAMRQEDQSLTLYKEAQDLCKVHKNRQNSVEFIPDIRFHVGMDARIMMKHIRLEAFEYFQMTLSETGSERQYVARITDKNPEDVTQAQINRFNRVLDELRMMAEKKVLELDNA